MFRNKTSSRFLKKSSSRRIPLNSILPLEKFLPINVCSRSSDHLFHGSTLPLVLNPSFQLASGQASLEVELFVNLSVICNQQFLQLLSFNRDNSRSAAKYLLLGFPGRAVVISDASSVQAVGIPLPTESSRGYQGSVDELTIFSFFIISTV